jgi:hypothetical protein
VYSWPADWKAFPNPIPSEVVSRAVALLNDARTLPLGQTKLEYTATSKFGTVPVTYQATSGGGYTRNVLAWVPKVFPNLPDAARHPNVIQLRPAGVHGDDDQADDDEG